MANVGLYIPFVFEWEGKISNNKNDKGGLTNMGVTWGTFQTLAKSVLGIEPTKENFLKLTKPQVEKIIKWYWNQVKGDYIKDQRVANVVTDWYWGSGKEAMKWTNGVMKKYFNEPMPKNASVLSMDTINKMNKVNQDKLYNSLTAERKIFIDGLVKKDKTQQGFYAGWINRLNDMWEHNKQFIKESSGVVGLLALAAGLILLTRKAN
ncbi:MAG: glycosyl hydrolase 108 family protein [Bacteroidales bacterium]|jgi:lysozyme family protein